MRLKHIKLAGFKSFVDPTKIPFEQQMTAIVGPNGCGKSNIIDAVRWVLGESSAKNLRGDAMTDVIFNGAQSRKPIGQASVELVFSNTSGRIQGQMADRNEVSIRRLVSRDSTNRYFLNGTQCRRRDITDIFLGTGLGPRSYAIIEQGTISRLIESKPQELRVFIEEAAGISKYKERRRETETRIRHTRENLERLNDIRVELSRQIDNLHQQAEAAKRFKTLKAQERTYRAELAVLRWQEFNEKSQQSLHQQTQTQDKIDLLITQQKEQNISLFQVKQQLEFGGENISELQREKIQLTNDIARSEQNIKHVKQQLIQAQHDNKTTEQKMLNAQQHLMSEQSKLTEYESCLLVNIPLLAQVELKLEQSQEIAASLSNDQIKNQQSWQEYHEENSKYTHEQAKLDSQIAVQLNLISRTKTRLKEVNAALNLANNEPLNTLEITQEQIALNALQRESFIEEKANVDELVSQYHIQISDNKQAMAKAQGALQTLEENQLHLNKQQHQQATWNTSQQEWLTQQSIEIFGTLHQQLRVDKGWEKAIELVLAHWLQAHVVKELPITLALDTALIVKEQPQSIVVVKGSIAEKISNLRVELSFLNQIYFAKNIEEAQQLLPELNKFESIICQDTTWLGHDFLRKGVIEQGGDFLQRANDLAQLSAQIEYLKAEIGKYINKADILENNISEQRQVKLILTDKINALTQQYQEQQQGFVLAEQNKKHQQIQKTNLQKELDQLEQQLIAEQGGLEQLNEKQVNLVLPSSEQTAKQLIELKAQQNQTQEAINNKQESIKQFLDERHKLAITIEQVKSEKNQSIQSLKRAQETIVRLTQLQESNQELLVNNVQPLEHDEKTLQDWLKAMSVVDGKIKAIEENLANAQSNIKHLEQQQKITVERLDKLKELLAQHHLDSESFRLRAESSLEALNEMQKNVSQVKENIPANAKQPLWQAHIIRLSKDISRLGPINLAAIDEYEKQLDRKNYLDQQNDDLILAITTLESVIEKIDKESRQKFKATFEQVNLDLKALFPKVFGGGSAYLELTGEDLLDTGVTIMARPPGKKNSTIHQLSGGEKALTALSLVFAIFRLNPAPFCMLDEVDAPLDDANVSRFCNLVREMSQTVQFIYISHNKIAMEMASHLTGVTMFEPGVSKMVAVDIDEAVAMAEIS